MGFDGTAFIDRFNTVWNGHDLDGILAMMARCLFFASNASLRANQTEEKSSRRDEGR